MTGGYDTHACAIPTDYIARMSKHSIIAKLACEPDNATELEAALAVGIAAAEEESGLEIYSVHKDPNEAGVYWFFELYTDGDALAAHGKGDGMRAAMKGVGGLLSLPPEVSILEPVVAKGLEL
jgi:quinol monooxygenase YgiN